MPEDREALHEVDLPLSLRRRLGLSGVVEKQIKRYSQLRDRKDRLSAQELARLLQLIGRRDDANAVFTEAGHRLAARDLRKGGLGRGVTSHAVPKGARQRLALRHARRLARDVSPGSKVLAGGRPPTLVVERCLPARAVNGGGGCSLLSGAIRSILDQYRVDDISIVHTACEGHAEDRCVWRLEAKDGNHAGAGAQSAGAKQALTE